MAHSLPLVAQNIFILKLKLRCTRCQNKLKRLLSEVEGIQTVNIDSKQGTITISGTVDPATIVALLGNHGRKAEVLWEQRPAPSTDNKNKLQLVPKPNSDSKLVDQFNFNTDMVAQLQQLCAGIKGLKSVEVCCSNTIRLAVNGNDGDDDDNGVNIGPGGKTLKINIRDGVLQGVPQIIPHSGGLCNASASCCGGHNLHHNVKNEGSCCCQFRHATAMGHPSWATYGYGFVPTGSPLPWSGFSPSAPPLGQVYDQPPSTSSSSSFSSTPSPAMGYSYSSFLSDDNPAGGCNII